MTKPDTRELFYNLPSQLTKYTFWHLTPLKNTITRSDHPGVYPWMEPCRRHDRLSECQQHPSQPVTEQIRANVQHIADENDTEIKFIRSARMFGFRKPERPKGWSTSFPPWNSAILINPGMTRLWERHSLSLTRANVSTIISISLTKNLGSVTSVSLPGRLSVCSSIWTALTCSPINCRRRKLLTACMIMLSWKCRMSKPSRNSLTGSIQKTSIRFWMLSQSATVQSLKRAEKRRAELDNLFTRLYEDWVAGRITEYNFNMLSAKYQDEQAQLDEQLRYHCSILQCNPV